MPTPQPPQLGAVQETLLVPLYGRATFTKLHPPLIDDPKAIEMVAAIDYDFSRLDGSMSLVGSVFRTRIYDRWVAQWLTEHPTGTVVEIGAGLNTRYERLDNGTARWIELDLPDTVALRRTFFEDSPRRSIVPGSVVDVDEWMPLVEATGGPWFFCSEAVLIYLEEAEVRSVLRAIGTRFPGAPVALDTWGTWMAENQQENDALRDMEAEFTWFCDDLQAFDLGGPSLELVDRCNFVSAPDELKALLPDMLREMLPALADDPQMTAYHQNLIRLGA